MLDTKQCSCRLCNGEIFKRFELELMASRNVSYWECSRCGSLQTDFPTWLGEAYLDSNLSKLDTGAALRTMKNAASVYALSQILNFTPGVTLLDFGGGDGLLARLLRDVGFDAQVIDAYARNSYAQGFEHQYLKYDVVTAFEVFEHMPSPEADLNQVFDLDPEFLVVSTALYQGQNEDWWYLDPLSGQHVFFYSEKAMFIIAERFGYSFVRVSDFFVFSRDPIESKNIRQIESFIMARSGKAALISFCEALSFEFAARDHNALGGALI